MQFKNKPTFGVATPIQEEKTTESVADKSFRPEVGAVWRRQSRNNTEYMNIKLELTKEKLQNLLQVIKEGETVQVNLVAFPNKTHNGNASRPNFRIYEELSKEST
jgi:uncharacterized protein (DUF736 family)